MEYWDYDGSYFRRRPGYVEVTEVWSSDRGWVPFAARISGRTVVDRFYPIAYGDRLQEADLPPRIRAWKTPFADGSVHA